MSEQVTHILRAMAVNYLRADVFDTLDSDALNKAADQIDALHAEAEALRVALLGIASVKPAERCIEWAKAFASDGLKGTGSDLYSRWLETFKEAEALRAENKRLSQQLAQSDNALRESRANDMANVRTLEDMWERHDALRQELEAARGLLEQCALSAETLRVDSMAHAKHAGFSDELVSALRKMTGVISGHGVGSSAYPSQREAINATPAPEVPDNLRDSAKMVTPEESLDDRLKQAGMLSVAELLKGAPLDAFIRHAGVHDLATLLQWAEMRRGEYLRMMARYDLGEKDKGDDLYEWTVAHCAVFTELHVNLRAALAEQGERQEAVAPDALRKRFSEIEDEVARGQHNAMSCFTAMRTAALYIPQPGPDVRGLVEALEWISRVNACDYEYPEMAKKALTKYRQAQQGDSHDH